MATLEDVLGEDEDEVWAGRRISDWSDDLNVSRDIVRASITNGNIMFLRTRTVMRLQGNRLNRVKLEQARRSYLVNGEKMREIPHLVVSAKSNYAYLTEGNHRLWAFKELQKKWFPVQLHLTWAEKRPSGDWQRLRHAKGFLQLRNTDTTKLPLASVGYPSYTPNTGNVNLMRSVYGAEVLRWAAPPTEFKDYDFVDAEPELHEPEQRIQAGFLCSQCSAVARDVCDGCAGELYCSVECQRAHYPAHREQCAVGVDFNSAIKKWRPASAGQTIGKFVDLGVAVLKYSIAAQPNDMAWPGLLIESGIVDRFNIADEYAQSLLLFRHAGEQLHSVVDREDFSVVLRQPVISEYANLLEREVGRAVSSIANSRIVPGIDFSTDADAYESRFMESMISFNAKDFQAKTIKSEWKSLFEELLEFNVYVAMLREADVRSSKKKKETKRNLMIKAGAVLHTFNRLGTTIVSFNA